MDNLLFTSIFFFERTVWLAYLNNWIMSTDVSGFVCAEDQFADPTTALLNWLSDQVFSKSAIPDYMPDILKRLIEDSPDSHIFLPVFQRILYSNSSKLDAFYNGDVISFFNWIDLSSTQMGLLYVFFKFNNNDVILLKRTEFSVYQCFIKSIWNDFKGRFRIGIFDELKVLSKTLMKINLYDELDELIFELSKFQILKTINDTYSHNAIFNQVHFSIMRDLYPLVSTLVAYQDKQILKDCLSLITKNALLSKRTDDISLLVENYPNSAETLGEFNICITKDIQKDLLVNNFITNLNKQLLLPSVKTINIILYYIKTIHSFLIIDHRGVLLDKVTRPIRHYLSMRNDTVEKVVDGLLNTDVKTNKLIELNHELHKNHLADNDPNSLLNLQKRTLNWEPDPVDALPDFKIGKIDDIIDSLISIFNDNNLFINQFVKLFSVDLLNIQNYNISDIMNNLVLLKTKFTNNDFNKIDIMINDILHSKELHLKINEDKNQYMLPVYKINAIFLSHLYWPNLPTDIPSFEVPQPIKADLEKYEDIYKTVQRGRNIKLHPQFSMANIDIETNGVLKTYNVTLDKLSVLNFIIESKIPIVKLGVIMMKLKMPLQLLKASLEFWVKENILIEINNGWKLNE